MLTFNPKMAGLLVIGMTVVFLGWQLRASLKREGELQAKLAAQAEATQEAADANLTNQATIDTLQARIAAMIEERRSDAAERERVLAERERELQQARARASQLERERENERRSSQDCDDLMSLDIGFFCPAAGEQLRERSRGPGGDGNEDGG